MTDDSDTGGPTTGSASDSPRRRVLRAIGAGSIAGMLAGCGQLADRTDTTPSSSPETTQPTATGTPDPTTDETDSTDTRGLESSSPFGEYDVIDGHVHILPRDAHRRPTVDPEEMLVWMDLNDIEQVVLLPLASPTSLEVLSPTWWNVDRAAEHPDRFIPFGVFDPRTLAFGRSLLSDRMQTWIENGVRGFGEFKANLPVDESRMRTVYEMCGEYGLPIVVHLDDLRARDEVGLPGLESVLQEFSHVDFIMHGTGWWGNISGNATEEDMGRYPSGRISEPGAVERLLTDYDNVYASIDAGSGWNALSRDYDYAQSLLESHHEQIVYGTDKMYGDQQIFQFYLMDAFDLPEEAWRNILSRNLSELMLDPPE